jgi:hypothetical protein
MSRFAQEVAREGGLAQWAAAKKAGKKQLA